MIKNDNTSQTINKSLSQHWDLVADNVPQCLKQK